MSGKDIADIAGERTKTSGLHQSGERVGKTVT